ncbi:MAG: hypothetical protein WD749_03140 [Phycisphaerales bacterium]
MARSVHLDILDDIHIASPCPARWEDMRGDDTKRFCGECRLNVYNLSAMTREEAASLITGAEGRLCAGFFRRADGTVLTRDCPVGLRAARAALVSGLRRVAAVVAIAAGASVLFGAGRPAQRLRNVQPFAAICEWLAPSTLVGAPPLRGEIMLGRVAPVHTPPAPQPPGNTR